MDISEANSLKHAIIENMSNEIILAIIAVIPTTATAISTVYLNSKRLKDREDAIKRDEEQTKLAMRNSSKSSIQNMIMQDIIRVELLGKLPENKDNIESEYENYHKNDGNGTVTRQVAEYNNWYSKKELCLRCFVDVEQNKPHKLDKNAKIK